MTSQVKNMHDGIARTRAANLIGGKRGTTGFTMLEVIIAVAIVVILMGVAFVAVWQTQLNMRQLSMDGTAKELYMAAQNHLTLADSQGLVSRSAKKGTPDTEDPTIYYFVYPSAGANPNDATSVLGLMLPFGSIDETVRIGGSYVIRYSPSTATVLDVFYAEDCTFAADDYTNLMSNYYGPEKKDARKSFNGTNTTSSVVIGYYGGEGAGGSAIATNLKAPTLKVVNADKLEVTVTSPKQNSDAATSAGATLQIRLIVEGCTSGASMWFDSATSGTKTTNAAGDTEFNMVFDDVTASGGRFVEVFKIGNTSSLSNKALGDGDKDFIPGEDLRIQAWVTFNGARATVAKSGKTTTNSLFATGKETDGGTNYTATIRSFRHLENLSRDVSNFNVSADAASTRYAGTVAANQVTDLTWSSFLANVGGAGAKVRYGFDATHGTFPLVTGPNQSGAGNYLPVLADYKINYSGGALNYSGGAHKITGVVISNAGAAGLFGTVNTVGSKISDLELVDFSVTSTGATSGDAGNAGALAGTVSNIGGAGARGTAGVEISNVLVRDGSSSNVVTSTSAAAGGLVGSMTGGSITKCAASVYVSGATSAGGLVGATDGVDISYSYSGGHTKHTNDSNVVVPGQYYVGNANVSGATAGGLVGTLTGGSVNACYSTCSVNGAATAAGLIGSAGGDTTPTVSNCYAVGQVDGGTKSALVGGTATTTNSYYLETIKGSGTDSDTEAWDYFDSSSTVQTLDTATYDAGVAGKLTAMAYEQYLKDYYNGKYPFKTVSELPDYSTSGTLTKHLTIHYGDWPAIVTLVVNS